MAEDDYPRNGVGGYPVPVVDGVRQSTALAYLTAEGLHHRQAVAQVVACQSMMPSQWFGLARFLAGRGIECRVAAPSRLS